MSDTKPHTQETQRTPNMINVKRKKTTSRHIQTAENPREKKL